MKIGKSALFSILGIVFLAAATSSNVAWAHRSHSRVGVFIGIPLAGSWHYPPRSIYYSPPSYYYSYPPTIVVPMSSPVYIEKQDQKTPGQLAPNYWYYCSNPQGYYPYVKDCPTGWQPVAPEPPQPLSHP